ncbi:cysteine-rich RECEPTOR-like kinase [Rhynchospora pubera]|uniref:non-specific serine/threonine protein kinase n=1 Tax=Rhynchospora pubera TaxID=906938 RepID=A0AAV8FAL7_9POAL|nr:cysteine-rich RECEPTOR-like kinase [Rhynchospora pubera]
MSFFHTIPSYSVLYFLFIIVLIAPSFDMILCCKFLNNTICAGIGNKLDNGSVLQSNVDILLADLPGNASQNAFVNTSVGEGQNRILGVAILFWGKNETNGGGLETTVYSLINNLSDSAAKNSETRSALGQASYIQTNTSSTTIYGLAQCTRDLSAGSCSTCLADYTGELRNRSSGSTYPGGRIVGDSCFIWYDNKPINNTCDQNVENKHINTSDQNSGNGTSPSGGGGKNGTKTITIVTPVSVVAGLLLVIIVIYFVWLRKRTTKASSSWRATGYCKLRPDIRVYSIYELKTATQNFSPSKILGRGGYGEVYQAVMHGKSVAIKRLLKASKENEQELIKELSLVSYIEHPNILKLVGYCFEKNQYFFVYEHMPNGSLDKHLKDPTSRQKLSWTTRFKIIKEIAQGLSYLHYGLEKRTTHVDLKLTNILLSKEMAAKIADFDMLRTFETDETHQSTEKGYGTVGYMAPEVNVLALRKNYSLKSDIYSLGIMVLEIVTGKGIHTFRKTETNEYLSIRRKPHKFCLEKLELQEVSRSDRSIS